jgi:putative mRNA 3-end processing factor
MQAGDLVVRRPEGLYCPQGDFHIDPWRKVERAVITHAHADHARGGHRHYLCSASGAGVLRARLGQVSIQTLGPGESLEINGVKVSLHAAGHVLGSVQVRLEHGGRVWVVSGDYKVEPDLTCAAFEPVRCDVFITECTFGLPIYRWLPSHTVFEEINAWWQANRQAGRPTVLQGYSFGKAQRLLAGVDAGIGPIVVHDSVAPLNAAYRAEGVRLPEVISLKDLTAQGEATASALLRQALVLAPPSAGPGPLSHVWRDASLGMASGWMQVRKFRQRAGLDQAFVLSDHADWPGLIGAIAATGAERVIVTHGQEDVLVRWLAQQGLQAEAMATRYGDNPNDQPSP